MLDKNAVRISCAVSNDQCECFDKLTKEEMQLVEEKQVTIEYLKGEVIAKQGSFTSHIVFICEGMVKVYYEMKREKMILMIAGPGSLLGLTSLTKDSNIFNYTASAYIDTIAKLIDIQTFKQLIHDNSLFAMEIINILSDNTNMINGRFFCLTHRQSFGKLADILLCLSGNVFKKQKFELILTRKEIAELAGMSTESVIRILKKFQDDKLIRINGKTLEITDVEGLYKICDHG